MSNQSEAENKGMEIVRKWHNSKYWGSFFGSREREEYYLLGYAIDQALQKQIDRAENKAKQIVHELFKDEDETYFKSGLYQDDLVFITKALLQAKADGMIEMREMCAMHVRCLASESYGEDADYQIDKTLQAIRSIAVESKGEE